LHISAASVSDQEDMMMRFSLMAAVGIMVMSTSACSAIFIKRVPDDFTPCEEPRCSGYGLPVTDGVLAGLYSAAASPFLVAATRDSQPSDDFLFGDMRPLDGLIGLVFLVPAVVHLASALYGVKHAGECRKAETAHEAWLHMGPDERKGLEERWQQMMNAD
jgi:hypothetical protein